MSEFSEEEQWERFKEWLKGNGLWILAGVLIGVGGLSGWRWNEARQTRLAETAAVRFEEVLDAYARNDATRAATLVEELNREFEWTPYASLATLTQARHQVEANELDKAAASLKSVMDNADDEELRLIARLRLARVQAAQAKYDEALATLAYPETGEFAPRFADTRGDVLFAKGDKQGALKEYLAARAAEDNGRVDGDLLDLKIRDLGGTPPVPAGGDS